MSQRFIPTILLCLPFLLPACVRTADDSASWIHETDNRDGTPVVRTLGGSTWNDRARLEEIVSIGLAEGPEEYLLGRIVALHATPDRIFLIDQKPLSVRAYDRNGQYLFTLGQPGSGPGEYLGPASLVVGPPDRTIYLRDAALSRISLFDSTGAYRASWSLQIGSASFEPLVMTTSGRLWTVLRIPGPPGIHGIRHGMVEVTDSGPVGDPLPVPAYGIEPQIIEFATSEGLLALPLPFSAETVWALSPGGAMISGVSDTYRLRIDTAAGTDLIIERETEAVALLPEERQWYRNKIVRTIRQSVPGWTWNGPSFPIRKPYFTLIVPDDSGRIWVIREGEGYLNPDGLEAPQNEQEAVTRPAWAQFYFADIFETTGRFLGSVELPRGIQLHERLRPAVCGDEIVLSMQGSLGELVVGRFRLVW